MYVVSIRYPKKPGTSFNLAHYFDVHIPMGMSLFRSINGFLPRQVFVQHSMVGLDGDSESSDSHAVAWLCFDTREQAEGFSRVFRDARASGMLRNDMPSYCSSEGPSFAVGTLVEYPNVEAIADRYEAFADRYRGKP